MKQEFDFGFSIVDEATLKQKEAELLKELEQTSASATGQQEKLDKLRDMIMVLLNGLLKDPDKAYIYWPNRTERIKTFIKNINDLVDAS